MSTNGSYNPQRKPRLLIINQTLCARADSDLPKLEEIVLNDQSPAAAATLVSCNSDDSDDDESWQELNENGTESDDEESAVTCLFCAQQLPNIQPAGVEHLRQKHDFDLSVLASKFDTDCYWFIKVPI